MIIFFFNDTATTEIYTLSLHDALPISLGQAYFSHRDCNLALPWLERVPVGNSRAAEAAFSMGVCRLLLNQPDKAEEIYSGLQNKLKSDLLAGAELPEILNNLALAQARPANSY